MSKVPHKPLVLEVPQRFCLQMREWKNYFTEKERKLILALALNYCVNYDKIKIEGYLISRHKLFLILRCDTQEADVILNDLHEQLRRQLRQELKMKRRFFREEEILDNEDIDELLVKIFDTCRLTDTTLIRLITGLEVELPYHSRWLEKLKRYVHTNGFCSAIDYAGGVGPVKVQLTGSVQVNNKKKAV
jgi:hypothetical protein